MESGTIAGAGLFFVAGVRGAALLGKRRWGVLGRIEGQSSSPQAGMGERLDFGVAGGAGAS